MEIKPYDFSRLASVSGREFQLKQALDNYAGGASGARQLLRSLEKVLQKSVRGGCTLHTKGFRLEAAKAWQQRLGEATVFATMSAVPGGPKAALIWEPVIALSVIDRILAGELNEVPRTRALSEIERGVLAYVMAKVFQCCHLSLSPEAMPIRLEQIHNDVGALSAIVEGSELVALAEVTLALPELSGVVQLVLPDIFIEAVMPLTETRRSQGEMGEAMRLQCINTLGDLSFPMWASLGNTTLTADEISHLKAGDIVLVDDPHCYFEKGVLAGDVVFHPRQAGVPTIVTHIHEQGPPARVTVKTVYHEA